jgi:hypothetical protein
VILWQDQKYCLNLQNYHISLLESYRTIDFRSLIRKSSEAGRTFQKWIRQPQEVMSFPSLEVLKQMLKENLFIIEEIFNASQIVLVGGY